MAKANLFITVSYVEIETIAFDNLITKHERECC